MYLGDGMLPEDDAQSLGCPSKMYLCGQIGVLNSIPEMTTMKRHTKISEPCTTFRETSCVLCLCLPKSVGEEIMTKHI